MPGGGRNLKTIQKLSAGGGGGGGGGETKDSPRAGPGPGAGAARGRPISVAPGRSLLKRSSQSGVAPVVDMIAADDPGLQVLKVVPGKGGGSLGGGGTGGTGGTGLPGTSGAATAAAALGSPHLGSELMRLRNPFQGSSHADILQKCE